MSWYIHLIGTAIQGDPALLTGNTNNLNSRHVSHPPEVSFAPFAIIFGICQPPRMMERGGSGGFQGGFYGKQCS